MQTRTAFHFSTGEQRGSLATQRSSKSTAASTLPRCSSSSPQACMYATHQSHTAQSPDQHFITLACKRGLGEHALRK